MIRQGKSGVAKPYAETVSNPGDAGDLHLSGFGGQAQPTLGLSGGVDAAVTPAGNEQLINSFTTGSQVGPVVARGGSGNVAVAWVSISQDGDSGGIYMRVYAPNGNAVTGEMRVNLATAGNQASPGITALSSGNFVVSWGERVVLNPPPQSTFLDQIHYRIYSPAGTPLTGELTANSAIHKSEGFPAIAALDGGGFAITWSVEFDDGRREIFVRTFNDAGVPNGNEQFANTFQGDTEIASRIAGLEGGGFVVFWETRPSFGPAALRAQRFDGNGSLVGAEFAPHEQPGTEERVNDVIGLAGGGFVFLYGRGGALYARVYGADGVATGGEKTIAGVGASDTGEELTALAGGGFAAAWETTGSSGADVHGRLFDASGDPISDEFTANQTTSGSQGFVDLVERADGSMVYAWSGNGTGDSAGVFMRAFDVASGPGPIVGDGGPNTLTGTPNDDVLNGLGGDDILNGLGGADTMSGGTGNDWYFVDNAGDQVIEAAGEGNDRVFGGVSYTLAAGADVELMSTDFHAGTAPINLTGNALANYIVGNAGDNILDGAGGADTLVGWAGNDGYFVDNVGDQVVENAGEGTDRVFASISYTLAAGVSVELLSTDFNAGTAAINLIGNELAQTIYGNDGDNILIGGAGADTLVGGAGNDFHFVDTAGDQVLETAGQGTDRVFAGVSYTLAAGVSVELMSTDFNAGTAAINLAGNELAQTIYGNDGANIIDGGAGADTLVGRAGNDSFAFTTALGAGNVDAIVDFQAGADRIHLDHNVFAGLGIGALDPNAFFAGSAAHDADDRIIYDQASGQLWFDADGSGGNAAMLFATLNGNPVLAASDFVVI